MKRVLLLLFLGLTLPVFVSTGDTVTDFGHNIDYLGDLLNTSGVTSVNTTAIILGGGPIVFHGEYVDGFNEFYDFNLVLTGETDNSSKVVAHGVILRDALEHSLLIKGYEYSSIYEEPIEKWVDATSSDVITHPNMLGARTEIEYHEPYGVLETKTELVKVNDTSSAFDWYDITVTQLLTPGANFSETDWEWGWISYTMNGSKGDSNVFLSDYDSPPTNELPTGLFSFLWRILNFSPRNFFPWLYVEELKVEGIDQSDFSLETFAVRYQAPDGYQKSNEPLEVRHHYVLRVQDGVKPKFWQQTQIKYVRGNVIAAPAYFSPLMHEGYLELR